MSLYPSLEDMKVDQMAKAQVQYQQAAQQAVQYPGSVPPQAVPVVASGGSSLYPSLQEYMGLDLSPETIAANMPVVAAHPNAVSVRQSQAGQMQVAPISGNDVGIRRAEIKGGVREVILCKNQKGIIGLRVRSVNKGLFVALVHEETPASMGGLRFGDQILQINGQNVAGWDTDKAMTFLKKASPERIVFAIRDRPFERTITMQKDSTGHIGFVFKDGRIDAIVKDSSAARNGVLIDHQLCEINGQNVLGLKDKETLAIIGTAPRTVTITILPCFIYKQIIKCMGESLLKKVMDHSIPDV